MQTEKKKPKVESYVLLYQECKDKGNKDKLYKEIYKIFYKRKIKTYCTNCFKSLKTVTYSEIKQALMISLYNACETYNGSAKFNTYVHKCFKNAIAALCNEEEKNSKMYYDLDGIDMDSFAIEKDKNIDNILDLEYIVNGLEEPEKILYNKRVREQKTFKEIGHEINLTKQGVKYRFDKIKDIIREHYIVGEE